MESVIQDSKLMNNCEQPLKTSMTFTYKEYTIKFKLPYDSEVFKEHGIGNIKVIVKDEDGKLVFKNEISINCDILNTLEMIQKNISLNRACKEIEDVINYYNLNNKMGENCD